MVIIFAVIIREYVRSITSVIVVMKNPIGIVVVASDEVAGGGIVDFIIIVIGREPARISVITYSVVAFGVIKDTVFIGQHIVGIVFVVGLAVRDIIGSKSGCGVIIYFVIIILRGNDVTSNVTVGLMVIKWVIIVEGRSIGIGIGIDIDVDVGVAIVRYGVGGGGIIRFKNIVSYVVIVRYAFEISRAFFVYPVTFGRWVIVGVVFIVVVVGEG